MASAFQGYQVIPAGQTAAAYGQRDIQDELNAVLVEIKRSLIITPIIIIVFTHRQAHFCHHHLLSCCSGRPPLARCESGAIVNKC